MYNVSFDDKIYLFEEHIKKETENVAHVLFCEKSVKYLPFYVIRHKLVLKAGEYHNEGFRDNTVTFMDKVFHYQTKINDLPHTKFDNYWWYDSIIFKYHIEFFIFFICFENQLGKFERELKEKLIYDS